MLKLKLLWAIIKRNWKISIYLALIIGVLSFYWNIRSDLKASQRREENLKTRMINAWKLSDKLKKSYLVEANRSDSLEGVLLTYMDVKVKPDTIDVSTEGTLIGNTVGFTWTDNLCYSAQGEFDIIPPYKLRQKVIRAAFDLKIEMTDLRPGMVYGNLTASPPCLKPDTVIFEVAPDVKGAYRDGFDTGEFLLGAGFMGIASFIILLFR